MSATIAGRTKSGYAAAARAAGRLLDRVGLLPSAAPPLAHRRRHWAYSLICVHDSRALARLDVPWWTYRAAAVVDEWLASRPGPVRVFEYGSGASTRWLAARADEVHSVEHDAAFAPVVAALVDGYDSVHLLTVPPVRSSHPLVPSAKSGAAGLDFADYVAAIDAVPGQFDLVVVDGRARAACLARALPRLRPDGMIVLDNSRRRRYRAAVAESGLRERRLPGLTPTLPYPDQTSVLTRGGG